MFPDAIRALLPSLKQMVLKKHQLLEDLSDIEGGMVYGEKLGILPDRVSNRLCVLVLPDKDIISMLLEKPRREKIRPHKRNLRAVPTLDLKPHLWLETPFFNLLLSLG